MESERDEHDAEAQSGTQSGRRCFDGIDPPVATGLYIAGAWTDAADGRRFAVDNPATGALLADIADAASNDAVAALDAAVAAQSAWAAVSPRDRATLLRRGHQGLLRRADDIALAITLESGKSLAEARGEVAASAESIEWSIERISDLRGQVSRASHGGFDILTRYEPIGPSLLITPWNFPLLMPARKVGAALAAGCTVVLKPAAETPLTAALMTEAFAEAGLPPGVLNLVPTTRDGELSASLMNDPRLRKISFTGSTATGSKLLAQAAPHVINASMELGGDGPFVVLANADLDLAVRHAITCKFRNAGQVCTTANRIIVDEAIAADFIKGFVAAVGELVVGDGLDPDTVVGPMISERQRRRSLHMIREACEAGATLLAGGAAGSGAGYFLAPTVLTDILPSVSIAGEELFAPIAAIYRAGSTDEAVSMANDTRRGLAAYVFSDDLREAMSVADRLESGMVGVNLSLINDSAAPFGGVKTSGLGREGGSDALHEYLETKYVALSR